MTNILPLPSGIDNLSAIPNRYNRFEIVPNLAMSDSFMGVFYLREDAKTLLELPECAVRIPFVYGNARNSRSVDPRSATQEVRLDLIYVDNFSSSLYLMGTISPLQNISTLEVARFIFERHADKSPYWRERILRLIAYLELYYVEDEMELIAMQFDTLDRHRDRTKQRLRQISSVRYKRLLDRLKCRIIVWYKHQQRKFRRYMYRLRKLMGYS